MERFRLEVRRPWESAFNVVSDNISIADFDYELKSDAQGFMSFKCDGSRETFASFIRGAEVRCYINEHGMVSPTPDFEGIIIDELNKEAVEGRIQEMKISVAGPTTIFDSIYSDDTITGIMGSSALIRLIRSAIDPRTGEPYYTASVEIPEDGVVEEVKAGGKILEAIKSVIGDKTLVDVSNALNIRFLHIFPIFHPDQRPTIAVRPEPDVKSPGYDVLLTDSELLTVNTSSIPRSYSTVLAESEGYYKHMNWLSTQESQGQRELLTNSKRDLSDSVSNGILRLMKNLQPTRAIEIELLHRKGIQLNMKVRVESDKFGVYENFVVLGITCIARPTLTFKIQLGFNFQQLEDFLEL
jgi:hypothetical protein